ncbi:MAG: hypothetical protein FJ249_00475 [Nitrospira sp.]|nr:hypothetical protein [Nitrospira sp.]
MPREAARYLQNAKALLKQAPLADDIYTDRKPVREAFGTAYLAVLEAIDAALLAKGVTTRELPRSVEAYRAALKRHFAAHNGLLLREFESLYRLLHIAGYYRGLLDRSSIVKDALRDTQRFIDRFR